MRFLQLITCCALMAACNDKPAAPATITSEKKTFSIPGAIEKIDSTYHDGSHKVSTYIDTVKKERIAYVKFYEDGQRYTDMRFSNGVLNGESMSFYKNGNKWSLNTYVNGILHGPYKTWHENGQLFYESNYVNGKQHGECFTYFPNGKLDTRGFYTDGEKSGIWTTYNREGKLMREVNYSKDKK